MDVNILEDLIEKPDDESSNDKFPVEESLSTVTTETTIDPKKRDQLVPVYLSDICKNISTQESFLDSTSIVTDQNIIISNLFVACSLTSVCMLQVYINEQGFKKVKKLDNEGLETLSITCFYQIVDKESHIYNFVILPSEYESSSSLTISKAFYQQNKIRREIRLIRNFLAKSKLSYVFGEQHIDEDKPFTITFKNGDPLLSPEPVVNELTSNESKKNNSKEKKVFDMCVDGIVAGVLSYCMYNLATDEKFGDRVVYIINCANNNEKLASVDTFYAFYKALTDIDQKLLTPVLKKNKIAVKRYLHIYNASHLSMYN